MKMTREEVRNKTTAHLAGDDDNAASRRHKRRWGQDLAEGGNGVSGHGTVDEGKEETLRVCLVARATWEYLSALSQAESS
jgi:hypothetical protein